MAEEFIATRGEEIKVFRESFRQEEPSLTDAISTRSPPNNGLSRKKRKIENSHKLLERARKLFLATLRVLRVLFPPPDIIKLRRQATNNIGKSERRSLFRDRRTLRLIEIHKSR
jgi:hypothetical protein